MMWYDSQSIVLSSLVGYILPDPPPTLIVRGPCEPSRQSTCKLQAISQLITMESQPPPDDHKTEEVQMCCYFHSISIIIKNIIFIK